jgi:hypothetical protein
MVSVAGGEEISPAAAGQPKKKAAAPQGAERLIATNYRALILITSFESGSITWTAQAIHGSKE